MSLMGFARDIGRRLFDDDADAAEEIKQLIESHNPGVNDLSVTFDDGIVGLGGDCVSAEAMQKCVLIAGNVRGVRDVHVTGLSVARVPKSEDQVTIESNEPTVEYYVIQAGDTLGSLAEKYYGSAASYRRIFEANLGNIEDPNRIYVGQKIRIPLR